MSFKRYLIQCFGEDVCWVKFAGDVRDLDLSSPNAVLGKVYLDPDMLCLVVHDQIVRDDVQRCVHGEMHPGVIRDVDWLLCAGVRDL